MGPAGFYPNSGNAFVECLGYARLKRLGDIGRNFLSEFRELLDLRCHHLEMFARMRGRQFKELRRGLYGQHCMGVVEGSVGIGARNLDELEITVCGALGGRRIAVLEEIGPFVRCRLGFVEVDLRLGYALLGDYDGIDGNSIRGITQSARA